MSGVQDIAIVGAAESDEIGHVTTNRRCSTIVKNALRYIAALDELEGSARIPKNLVEIEPGPG